MENCNRKDSKRTEKLRFLVAIFEFALHCCKTVTYYRRDGEPVPYNMIVLRIGKLEFDYGSNDTERVREITKPYAPGTHCHRALRGNLNP